MLLTHLLLSYLSLSVDAIRVSVSSFGRPLEKVMISNQLPHTTSTSTSSGFSGDNKVYTYEFDLDEGVVHRISIESNKPVMVDVHTSDSSDSDEVNLAKGSILVSSNGYGQWSVSHLDPSLVRLTQDAAQNLYQPVVEVCMDSEFMDSVELRRHVADKITQDIGVKYGLLRSNLADYIWSNQKECFTNSPTSMSDETMWFSTDFYLPSRSDGVIVIDDPSFPLPEPIEVCNEFSCETQSYPGDHWDHPHNRGHGGRFMAFMGGLMTALVFFSVAQLFIIIKRRQNRHHCEHGGKLLTSSSTGEKGYVILNSRSAGSNGTLSI